MAITEEQNERLTEILQALEPECKRMAQVPRQFVEDQIKRHGQYGDRIFMSPKQIKWLEDLYVEYAGGERQETTRGPDDEPGDERPVPPDDDSIPF